MASSLAAVQHMKLLTKISDPAVQAEVVDEAIVWSIQHGLVMGLGGDAPPGSVSHAPLALLPMPYPRDAFERAQRAALAFSSMIDRVSRDEPYLEATLRPAAAHDPFTARLLQLLVETRPQRSARPTRVLSVLRSDYMLHEDDSLLQVELNTIASSFASLSSLTSRLHHSVLDRLGAGAFDLQALPHNDAMDGIAKALGSAHMHYVSGRPQLAPAKASDAQEAPVASSADAGGRGAGPLVSEGLSGGARSEGCSHSAGGSSTGRGGGAGGITLARTFAPQVHPTPGAPLAAPPEPRASKPVILFVVQPGERNAVDQHWLRSRLWDLHRVRVARLTLEEVAERCSLRESPKGASPAEQELWIDAQGARPRRVSVVYLRAGYAPDDYVSDRCWAARALLERSAAFLCPTAALQLAGAKRVQQDLSAPGVVERFSATDAEARALRSFFAEQWSLEGLGRAEEGDGARAE
ncbi:glutathione synthase, partial [Helicosporidium sp. ATCC 50920]